MKVTRDPNNEHIANGGTYIGNMNRTKVWLDGTLLDIYDVITADHDNGEVHLIERDENGFPLMVSEQVPQTKIVKGKVDIEWPEEDCTGCAENGRKKRMGKNWWML